MVAGERELNVSFQRNGSDHDEETATRTRTVVVVVVVVVIVVGLVVDLVVVMGWWCSCGGCSG